MAKKVVRIIFMDEAGRSFAIEENTTAEQLRAMVVEKLALKEDSCFALFERKEGWERCLEPDEKPAELMNLWTIETKKNKEETSTTSDGPCFLFKKKIFLRDDEREMSDPVAKHFVYIQVLCLLFLLTSFSGCS